MSFYLRKSVRVGPLRFNLSGSGIGVSTGIKGFRVGAGPRGNYVHLGRGGLYYRSKLGGAKRPTSNAPAGTSMPVTPSPVQRLDTLTEIESASVVQMAPASAADLLAEIRTKRKRIRFWPLVLIIGGALLAFAGQVAPPWLPIVGLLLLIVATVWVGMRDALRRTVVLFYELDGPMEVAYEAFHSGFAALTRCARVWHLEAQGRTSDWKRSGGASVSVRRQRVVPAQAAPTGIKTNIGVPSLPVGRQVLYFFPDRVLVTDGSSVGAVEYLQLQAESRTASFIEEEWVPPDAEVVSQTWKYVNKKGGPDRRFKNNRQIPVVRYGECWLHSESGLNEAIQTSHKDAPEQFAQAVRRLVAALAATGEPPLPGPPAEGAEITLETSEPRRPGPGERKEAPEQAGNSQRQDVLAKATETRTRVDLSGRDFTFDIVGESFHEQSLRRLDDGRLAQGVTVAFTALIVPDPANPFSKSGMAVMVAAEGIGPIGHFSEDEARRYRAVSEMLLARCAVGACPGWLIGGRRDAPSIGARLAIVSPEEILGNAIQEPSPTRKKARLARGRSPNASMRGLLVPIAPRILCRRPKQRRNVPHAVSPSSCGAPSTSAATSCVRPTWQRFRRSASASERRSRGRRVNAKTP